MKRLIAALLLAPLLAWGQMWPQPGPGHADYSGGGGGTTYATISNAQAWLNDHGSGGTNGTPLVGAVSADDLIVVEIGISSGTATITSITDDIGDSGGHATAWAQAVSQASATMGMTHYIWWRQVGASPSGSAPTITVNWSTASAMTVGIAVFQPSATAQFSLDGTPASDTQDNTANVPNAGSITVASSSALLVGGASTFNTMPTAGGSFTRELATTFVNNDAVEDQIASAGSYNVNWAGTSAGEYWIAVGAAWKAVE